MIYKYLQHIVLRTPSFPIERIKALTKGEKVTQQDLIKICHNPFVSEALFLASPSFHSEVVKWIEGKLPNKKEEEKVKQGVYRYFARMCTRCTPFGLFAGISVGTVGESTNIEIGSMENHQLHLRLDMNYVCALAKDIAHINEVKKHLRFFPNDSQYRIGDKLRYVEYTFANAKRKHHLAAVDASSYLKTIMDAAQQGMRLEELADLLIDDEITKEEAVGFIEELVENQLLISELEPTVIGDDPIRQMINVLKCYPCGEVVTIVKQLEKIDIALHQMSETTGCHSICQYEGVKDLLKAFTTCYDEKFLFQGDLWQQTKQSQLSQKIVEEVFESITMINRITPAFENENLKNFREAFYARYEDEEIPLALALDTETGVGYLQNTYGGITPLVDDISFPIRMQSYRTSRILPFNVLMEQKLSEALRNGSRNVSIDDKDLEGFESNWNDTQETLSAFVQLIDNERFFLKSVGGSCAANLIGRFCHLDKSLLDHTRQIISQDEANANCIYAEIVHLPESRIGNILHRPSLRQYEIHYLAHSSQTPENQIDINDMMISVRGDKIVLRSKRLNKTIIPRLTTAHNFSANALPVYQFLCDLQNQGKRGGLGFSWGSIEQTQPYLPSVSYKNAILSLETWNFFKKDIDQLNNVKNSDQQIELFMEMAKKQHISDEVMLEDNDNELYLNLKNRTCVSVLLNLVKKRHWFTLKAFPFASCISPVKCGDLHYTDEILLAYYRNHEKGDGL
jgi:hypothetical protein